MSDTAATQADDREFPVFDPTVPLPTGRLLIEASAGTGKTYTISTLAVRFVAEVDGVGAAGLCVVSFTEAATAELRSRIRQRMVEVADALESGDDSSDVLVLSYRSLPAADQPVVIGRLRRATEEFDRATITTIHGFCSRVLGALGAPVGAVGPGGNEVAEVVNDLLLTRARPLAGPLPHPADVLDTGPDAPVPDGSTTEATWPEGLRTLDAGRFAEVVGALVQLPLATMDGADGTGAGPARPPADEDELRHRTAEVALEARRLVADRRRSQTIRSFDSLLSDVRNLLDPAAGATDATRAAVRAALAGVRVVMVDEFQDTDGLQWAIFDHAFPVGTCPMVLVGDPKQSIYRFRSAELSAYLAARSGGGVEVATLATNFRSDPGVLAGIERLYLAPASDGPYVLGRDATARPAVHFRPVEAHHSGRRLEGMDLAPSVELRVLDPAVVDVGDRAEARPDDDGSTDQPARRLLPTGVRKSIVAEDVARQVARLLRAADPDDERGRRRTAVRITEPGEGGIGRDLRPSDIAVLVTTNDQALAVAHRLGRVGIAAATATTNSVLDGAAAWQWRLLLAALTRPASPGPARAAALGWFLGYPAASLADPDADLAAVHEQLARWASVLRAGGPIALLADTRRAGLADRLLARPGGERRITDLEHIAELLQAVVGSRPAGALEVAEALDELSAGGETEAAVDAMSRRIDRDDDAVQVLTVHRAKGLEFPVVLCPFLWTGRPMRGVPHAAIPLTDDDGEVIGVQRRIWTPWTYGVDKGTVGKLGDFRLGEEVAPGGQEAKSRFKLEHLEEADRLTYVALTRAAAHLVVWWASPADASGRGGRDQALARLLSHATGLSTADLVADPWAVRVLHGDAVAVELVVPDAPMPTRVVRDGVEDLERASYTRPPDQSWRRWSYSRLSEHLVGSADRGARGVLAVGEPGGVTEVGGLAALDPDDGRLGGVDERVGAGAGLGAGAGTEAAGVREASGVGASGSEEGVSPPDPVTPDPFGGLGGTRFGTTVHSVLEQVDFTSVQLTGDLHVLLGDAMAHWRTASLAPVVASGLASALLVPLGGPLRAPDTRLVALPPDQRLNELQFDLALGRTTLGDIAGVLAGDPAVTAPFGRWLDRLGGGPQVEGMLTGSIDLVGSFDGEQYWVADHKTNLVAGGYGPEPLADAMVHHDYPLQATLYLVALHRFLAQRLAGYDPDRHLAGAAYLFVRGMAADGSGIYWFTPSAATIVAVSDLLAEGVGS